MAKTYPFDPDYAVPPSETLKEVLEDRGISLMVFSESVDIAYEELLDIMDAKRQIDEKTALELERVLEIPTTFWLALEKNYQSALQGINTTKLTEEKEMGVFRVIYFAQGLQRISIVVAENEEKAGKMVSKGFGVADNFVLDRIEGCSLTNEYILHTEVYEII